VADYETLITNVNYGGNMDRQNKQSKNINPLWILLIGIGLFFIGSALSGMIGSFIAVAGEIFILVGIIDGFIYLFKKKG